MARKTMKMFPTFDNAGVHNSKCNCNTFYISFKIIESPRHYQILIKYLEMLKCHNFKTSIHPFINL